MVILEAAALKFYKNICFETFFGKIIQRNPFLENEQTTVLLNKGSTTKVFLGTVIQHIYEPFFPFFIFS